MLFVNWLHQVLKKLQEVTVTTPLKQLEQTKNKDKSLPKEKKHKDKKDKQKSKKKKRDKSKGKPHHKKEDKKSHKSKKKSKHHEMIRPNVPPLLMNIEKESEPSITDVFAGQILKNHGVSIDTPNDSLSFIEKKPTAAELKRPILPIIDPATIGSQINLSSEDDHTQPTVEVQITEKESHENADVTNSDLDKVQAKEATDPREEQIKEIETKVKNLKQKLTEQLDVMSDDEDFLNIRTEADELMNDFAEDVLQEITAHVNTSKQKSPLPLSPKPHNSLTDSPKPVSKEPMELPQIELKLPKRPIRERLGAKEPEMKNVSEVTEKATIIGLDSPERFTPDREPEIRATISAKSRLGELPDVRKASVSDEETKAETVSKRLPKTCQESRVRGCASVVRVRPRPRVAAPASSLLLRAVADAQKSLMNIPTKHDQEPHKVKRALVLPMRRTVDPQKIVIQVARGETERQPHLSYDPVDYKEPKLCSDVTDSSTESSPIPITKKIVNTDYVPPRRTETRTSTKKDDTLIVETINIHNQTVDKEKDTQFIVTMDGYHLNALLAKKLKTEGILDEEDELKLPKIKKIEKVSKSEEKNTTEVKLEQDRQVKTKPIQSKHSSDASEESDTQVIIKDTDNVEKRKSIDILKDVEYNKINLEKSSDRNEKRKSSDISNEDCKEKPFKKRKASPIVFSVEKQQTEKQPVRVRTASTNSENQVRPRTASASSDNQVTVTTNVTTAKYDTLPPLSATNKPVVWCRTFPLCRFGSACAYSHPRCKFAAACTRRNCMYSHSPQVSPVHIVASHVVPAANYKSISAAGLPSLCKFYPNCVNPACHFYHPKPCRYGKACLNKLECNFYHNDVPSTKWRYPV